MLQVYFSVRKQMLQVDDLKKLETGHYVLYIVTGYYNFNPKGDLYRIPFISETLANECSSVYQEHWAKFAVQNRTFSRVQKVICVFDGELMHSISMSETNPMKTIDSYNEEVATSQDRHLTYLTFFDEGPRRRRSVLEQVLLALTCCCCLLVNDFISVRIP
jgi:hypothetical protein